MTWRFPAVCFVIFLALISWAYLIYNKDDFKKVPDIERASILVIKNNQTEDLGISIISLGDMMFDRGVEQAMNKGTNPFEFIHFNNNSFKVKVDFVMGNLEGPITDATNCQVKAYSFKFATTTGFLLKKNGIDAVNMANNHSMDCFQKGFEDTKKYLEEAGVVGFGGFENAENTKEVVVKGHTIALVGIDMTLSNPNISEIGLKITELKKRNDYVLINIHWGEEYLALPTQKQIETGHALVDAGADVIFGHHPHVIEPIEVYKGKTIFYSLGNFIFDQTDENGKKGIIAHVILKDDGTQTYEALTYYIDRMRPHLTK